jgi:hypothetical protein
VTLLISCNSSLPYQNCHVAVNQLKEAVSRFLSGSIIFDLCQVGRRRNKVYSQVNVGIEKLDIGADIDERENNSH